MKPLLGVNVAYHQFHEDAVGSLTNGLLETLFVTYLYIERIANLLYTKKLPSSKAALAKFSQTIQVSTHVHAASFRDEWLGTGVLSAEIPAALSKREPDSF